MIRPEELSWQGNNVPPVAAIFKWLSQPLPHQLPWIVSRLTGRPTCRAICQKRINLADGDSRLLPIRHDNRIHFQPPSCRAAWISGRSRPSKFKRISLRKGHMIWKDVFYSVSSCIMHYMLNPIRNKNLIDAEASGASSSRYHYHRRCRWRRRC